MTLPIVVMGVSGSGKSTLGRLLAEALGRPFIEGDDLHPPANLTKMASGQSLTDEDRRPFLDNVAHALIGASRPPVASCSALKRVYRDQLRSIAGDVLFVLPQVMREELTRRMTARREHFMPASLLDSQLATLELPGSDECAILIDGALSLEDQLSLLLTSLPADR